MNNLINRPQYLEQLIGHKDVDLVKIVTGIRRCGKSSLLDLFHQYLLKQGIDEKHIIHMNLESLKYRNLIDYIALYEYVSERIPEKGKIYLIFDELQNVEHWEKAIESFRLDFDVDIYITGSNAYLLSTEFSTLLSGRYVEIRMLPLSFVEFLNFNTWEEATSIDEKFQKYLADNGIQTLIHYPIPPHKQEAYREWNGLSFPITEKIHREVVSIPISPVMEEDEINRVVETINAYK